MQARLVNHRRRNEVLADGALQVLHRGFHEVGGNVVRDHQGLGRSKLLILLEQLVVNLEALQLLLLPFVVVAQLQVLKFVELLLLVVCVPCYHLAVHVQINQLEIALYPDLHYSGPRLNVVRVEWVTFLSIRVVEFLRTVFPRVVRQSARRAVGDFRVSS